MSIETPLQNAIREQEIQRKAATALRDSRITQEQHDYLIAHELTKLREEEQTQTTQTNEETQETQQPKLVWDQRKIVFSGATVIMLILTVISLFTGQGITGFVAYEPLTTPFTITEHTNITLNEALTAIRVSGSHSGHAEIYAWIAGERLLVYNGTAELPSTRILTDKTEYELNETVVVTVYPLNSSHTLWLTMPNNERVPVFEPFVTEQEGLHLLEAIVNDSGAISKVSTTYDVVANSDGAPRVEEARATFTNVCGKACNVNNSITELELITDDTLTIDEFIIENAENNAPIASATIPDIVMNVGENTSVDLSNYFVDPDNDDLLFDINNMIGVNENIDGNALLLRADIPGTYAATVYASDLVALTQNTFTITVNEAEIPIEPATNATNTTNATNMSTEENITNPNNTNNSIQNVTTNTTSENINTTTNKTEPTIPTNTTNISITLDCSNPDPNARPLECLQNDTIRYFPDQSIMITNNDRGAVARISPIGNLLLTGDYYENSVINAPSNDYTIGYRDEYNNYVATIWFETNSGNLYVKGKVVEENSNLQPAKGSYILRNDRGVVLAWADPQVGNFYVRGNIIPYRRSLE